VLHLAAEEVFTEPQLGVARIRDALLR